MGNTTAIVPYNSSTRTAPTGCTVPLSPEVGGLTTLVTAVATAYLSPYADQFFDTLAAKLATYTAPEKPTYTQSMSAAPSRSGQVPTYPCQQKKAFAIEPNRIFCCSDIDGIVSQGALRTSSAKTVAEALRGNSKKADYPFSVMGESHDAAECVKLAETPFPPGTDILFTESNSITHAVRQSVSYVAPLEFLQLQIFHSLVTLYLGTVVGAPDQFSLALLKTAFPEFNTKADAATIHRYIEQQWEAALREISAEGGATPARSQEFRALKDTWRSIQGSQEEFQTLHNLREHITSLRENCAIDRMRGVVLMATKKLRRLPRLVCTCGAKHAEQYAVALKGIYDEAKMLLKPKQRQQSEL